MVRVSSRRQDTDRQEHELREHASKQGWEVVEVIREKVSGRASSDNRPGIQRLYQLLEANKIHKVLVHEISRLGRKNSVVHTVIEALHEKGVSLYWHQHGIETLTARGTINGAASMMLSLLSEMARAETETARERIISGLEEARRKGVVLGRKPGSAISPEVFLERNKQNVDIVRRHPGVSLRNLAKMVDLAPGTIQKIRSLLSRPA